MYLSGCEPDTFATVRSFVERTLRDCRRIEDAAPVVIEALCATQGWPFGTVWIRDDAQKVLRCAGCWHRAGDEFLAELAALTRALTFAKGLGAPGRVWLTGEPALVERIRDQRTFARRDAAAHAGLVCAVVFPILHDGEVLGAIDLIGRASPHDAELQGVLREVGRQLGRFLATARASTN